MTTRSKDPPAVKPARAIRACLLTALFAAAVWPPAHAAGEERAGADLFARIALSRQSVYVGEPFELTVSVYARRIGLAPEIAIREAPAALALGPFRQVRAEPFSADGLAYVGYAFRADARAHEAGQLAVTCLVGVSVAGSATDGPPDSPDPEARSAELRPAPVPLLVQPTPEQGRPGGFSGAVGVFELGADVRPDAIFAGEPVTVTMVVSGRAALDAAQCPAVRVGKGFKAYPAVRVREERRGAAWRTVFKQIVVPELPAANTIEAVSFSYFDTERRAYRTLERGPFLIRVRPIPAAGSAAEPGGRPGSAQVAARRAEPGFAGLKGAPRRWRGRSGSPWYRHVGVFGLHAVPPLLLLGLHLVVRQRAGRGGAGSSAASRRRSVRLLRIAFGRIEAALAGDRPACAYEAAWRALVACAGADDALAPGEAVSENILRRVRTLGWPMSAQVGFGQALAACEQGRFAPAARGSSPDPSDPEERIRLELLRAALGHVAGAREGRKPRAPRSTGRGSRPALLAVLLCVAAAADTGQAPLPVQTASRQFLQAAQACEEGRADRGVELYAELAAHGYAGPEVLFNLGNALRMEGNLPEAIRAYRRAWYVAPRDADIRLNLEAAMRQAGVPAAAGARRAGTWPVFSDREWAAAVLACYWLLMAGAARVILDPGRARRLKPVLVALCVALIVAGLGFGSWLALDLQPEAVVTGAHAQMRFAPVRTAPVKSLLAAGAIVRVVRVTDGWARLRVRDTYGWMRAEQLTPVRADFDVARTGAER
ncbi:MAG: BatD family protein [Kiritimatiellae bacterium]|nr:BatD family protein [Kiritimatiellia bacterium]